jgi:hypothetical protein
MKTLNKCLPYCLLLFPFLAQGQATFRNVGKMHIGRISPEITSLYIPGNQLLTGHSSIRLNGTLRLGGDLIANRMSEDIHGFMPVPAGSKGKLLFKGNQRQRITTDGLAFDRTANYLGKIPALEIDNRAGVHLSNEMGITVDTLNLLKGKFILGSQYIDGTQTRLAHLLVDSVKYNRADSAVVEIEMVIGDPLDSEEGRQGKFMGFSPPFKRMYADYFIYNYLLAPDNAGLFGRTGGTLIDPAYALEAGRGYLVGQNIYNASARDEYTMMPYLNLTEESYNNRMRDTLLLNRYALKGIHVVDVSGYPVTKQDACEGESLNTGDVTVALEQGFNYLGNPYTCPLDLSALKNPASSADEWNVTRDTEEENPTADIYSAFWVLHGGEKTAHDPESKTFTVGISYDISQLVGATVSADSVSPMQLFLVYANRPCTLKIPASKRVHRSTDYLKSGNVVTDELLLEVKDQTTEGFDRMCVVFRNHAGTGSKDPYDAGKIINTSKGVSQIYTTSSDNVDLITNVISTAQESLPVTLVPSATEQEVELTASRMETLISPESVQLQDLKTGEIVDLTKQSYRFTTSPEDDPKRFILHFRDVLMQSTNVGALRATPSSQPRIAYISSEITIIGLQKEDAGSHLTIADAQGRILLNETFPANVGETGKVAYRLPLSSGIYVASLSGKRSLTLKFIGR